MASRENLANWGKQWQERTGFEKSVAQSQFEPRENLSKAAQRRTDKTGDRRRFYESQGQPDLQIRRWSRKRVQIQDFSSTKEDKEFEGNRPKWTNRFLRSQSVPLLKWEDLSAQQEFRQGFL